jgi:hypothetical protein
MVEMILQLGDKFKFSGSGDAQGNAFETLL